MKPSHITADAFASAERAFTILLDRMTSDITPPQGVSNEKAHQFASRERAIIAWMIADAMKGYAESMIEDCKKRLEAHGLFAAINKVEPGTEATIYEGGVADLVLKVANGAVSVDKELLKARLSTIHNFSDDEVEKLFIAVTKKASPRKSYRIVPKAAA